MGRRTLLSTTACLTMMDVAESDRGGMNAQNESL
jgi:hypothetical protein